MPHFRVGSLLSRLANIARAKLWFATVFAITLAFLACRGNGSRRIRGPNSRLQGKIPGPNRFLRFGLAVSLSRASQATRGRSVLASNKLPVVQVDIFQDVARLLKTHQGNGVLLWTY